MKPAQVHVIGIALLILVVATGLAQAGELRTTLDQQFYVNGSWVAAAALKPGDIVQTYDGKRVRITNVTDVTSDKPLEVYGFTTKSATHGCVLAGGILTRADTGRPESNTGRISAWRRWWVQSLLFWHRRAVNTIRHK
jgi:hypothetical protein